MPELPEAETIVRGLRPSVVGRRVTRVEVLHADVLRQPRRRLAAAVRGRRITGVERRGKNVVLRLDDRSVVAVNLGMTGGLIPVFGTDPCGTRPSHPAIRFRFDGEGCLVFNDQRRFGTVEALTQEEWANRSGRLGPEPLDRSFTARILHRRLSASRSPVRSWMLDQRRIAGVGNIYAAEALHLAGIHPQRPARSVDLVEARRLHRGLRSVLRAAIDHGGTTIRDYRDAQGDTGEYAPRLQVYGREGAPCHRCGTPVDRVVFSGRSAFFCPSCQPA